MLQRRDRDSLRRFLFEKAPIRGEIVHLDATWQAVLERHSYPEPVRGLLGEAMAAVSLLAATLKFKGTLTLQLRGSGPVSLLVVECTSERSLRGLAKYQPDIAPGTLRELLGDGRLIITIDPSEGRERYQGIVAIEGERLADALQGYLRQSEQLDTCIWLEADAAQATGMLLQRLPGPLPDADLWRRAESLGGTITRDELLEQSAQEIIHRLFHEEDIRLFEAEPVCFRCSCSRERVGNMLRTLGRDEVEGIIQEQGRVSVDCEFCHHHYEFDSVDAEQLFAPPAPSDLPPTQH